MDTPLKDHAVSVSLRPGFHRTQRTQLNERGRQRNKRNWRNARIDGGAENAGREIAGREINVACVALGGNQALQISEITASFSIALDREQFYVLVSAIGPEF